MRQFLRWFHWHRGVSRGETIEAFGKHITPMGRFMAVMWPGDGLTWHAPLAVEVREGDDTRWIPVRNGTRKIVTSIVLGGFVIAALASRWQRAQSLRKRRRS